MRWWADLPGKLLGPMFALDAVRVGRRKSTFVVRWLYLAALTFVLAVFFWGSTNRLSSSTGGVAPSVLARFAEDFFWVYAVTQFLVVAALTPAFTAAAITDEKERKTLDFLLVTDLSTHEILLGKLAARGGLLFTLVLAGLPILSLVQFFGGIDPDLLLYGVAVTVATLVSLAAVSLACSVQLARTRDAVVLAYVLPTVYFILSAVWWGSTIRLFGADPPDFWDEMAQAFAVGNPFVAVGAMSGPTGMAGDAGARVAWYCGAHLAVALLALAFASLRLRRVARAAGASAAPASAAGKVLARVGGRRTEARTHPEVTDHPVAWREVYVEPGSNSGVLRAFLRFIVVGVIAWTFFNVVTSTLLDTRYATYGKDSWQDFQERTKAWVCGVTGVLGTLLLLGATVRGAGCVAGEKDRDTWTNLLTTPLTVREILAGKWWGCVWGQRHAYYLLGGVWLVGMATGSVNPISLVLTAIAFAVYLTAFAWLGIACSANPRTARAAITRAVPQAILYGGGFWLFLGCCCLGGALGGPAGALGEAIGHLAAFIAGFTPAAVLGGLPAVDDEVLNRRGSGPDSYMFATAVGVIFGTMTWCFAALSLRDKAHERMATDANRVGELPPRRLG